MERILDENGTGVMKNFPNGFTSWAETYAEICMGIGVMMAHDSFGEYDSNLEAIYKERGIGGLYEFAEDLTDEFEESNCGVCWGEDEKDYFLTISKFIIDRL